MKSVFNIFICCVFFAAMGCSPVYYQPNLMNMPNFREKGEVYLAASKSNDGGDVQAAYAFSNHFAVQANFMKLGREGGTSITAGSTTTTNTIVVKGYLGEAAIGFYSPMGKTATFSLFGGYGLGKISNNWASKGASLANFNKPFIQPTLGLRYNSFELIYSAKLANLTYYNQSEHYNDQDFISDFQALKRPIAILETGGAIRVGWKFLKFQWQVTTMQLLKASTPSLKYHDTSMDFGVCIQLNSRKEAETKPPKSKKKESDPHKVRYKLF